MCLLRKSTACGRTGQDVVRTSMYLRKPYRLRGAGGLFWTPQRVAHGTKKIIEGCDDAFEVQILDMYVLQLKHIVVTVDQIRRRGLTGLAQIGLTLGCGFRRTPIMEAGFL
jgi:hypothetical protein